MTQLPILGTWGRLNPATVPSDVYAHKGNWVFEVVDRCDGGLVKWLQIRPIGAPDKDPLLVYPEDFITNEVKR